MENIDDLHWRKASKSGNGGDCVEMADTPDEIYVRDTKRREAGHITVKADSWRAFVAEIKAGQHDV